MMSHDMLICAKLNIALVSFSDPKPPCREEGLVTFEHFLGYAHCYVIVLQMVLCNPYGVRMQVWPMLLGYRDKYLQSDWLARNKTADSAQPRKHIIVTRLLSS